MEGDKWGIAHVSTDLMIHADEIIIEDGKTRIVFGQDTANGFGVETIEKIIFKVEGKEVVFIKERKNDKE